MATAATIAARLILDSLDYKKGLESAEKLTSGFAGKVKDMGATLAKLGTVAAGVAAAGVAGVTAFLVDSAQAASEAEDIQSQLNAVLKSTGGIAGVTAEQVNTLAESLGGMTKFEDDAIVAGENILLTFTNIGKDVFPQATETMLDMSQALGQDLKSSAIQLGKALQDPEAGVTALSRVGVNFTDQQKEMIKAMVKAGKVADAQKFILKELQTEFGGSAKAAGQTFAGQLTILQNKLGNVKETIGTAVLPILTTLATMLISYLSNPAVIKWIEGFAEGIKTFGEYAAANIPLVIGYFEMAFTWLQQNQGVVVGILAALGAAIVALVYTVVIPAALAAISSMAPILLIMALIGAAAYLVYTAWTENWGGIQEKTAALWAAIEPVFQQIVTWFQQNIPIAIEAVVRFWNEVLYPGIRSAMTAIIEIVSTVLTAVADWWSKNGEQVLATAKMVWSAIWSVISLYLANVQTLFEAFSAAFNGDWYTFGAKLREIWDRSWKFIEEVVLNTYAWINSIDWGEVGRNIISGIVNGLRSAAGWLEDAARDAANAALEAAKGFLGIRSPSKVFAGVGRNMMLGWGEGIKQLSNIPVEMVADVSAGTLNTTAMVTSAPLEPMGGSITNDQSDTEIISLLRQIASNKGIDEAKLGRIFRDSVLQVIK